MLDPSMVTLGKGVLLKKKKQNDGIHSRNLYNKCDWVLKVFADFFLKQKYLQIDCIIQEA
jgi:hypothetical protein